MSSYTHVNDVLIGDGTNSGATTIQGIDKGDLYLVNEAGAIITTNAAAAALPKFEKVKIMVGIGPNLGQTIVSKIQGNMVSAYKGASYRAPVEQVSYVGYNGTDGTITVDPSTNYRLRVGVNDDARPVGFRKTFGDYHYAGTPTSTVTDCLDGIACLYAKNEYGHTNINDKVKVERVGDGAMTATANTVAIAQGSDIVVSTGHNATLGGYFRFGGAGTTFPIYKVVEVIDANTFRIDVPYLGATETALAAANAGIIAASTNYGFKLTGVPQEALTFRAANEPWGRHEWVLFDASFAEADESDLNSVAPYRKAVNIDPGQGYWAQVAQREEDNKPYRGDGSKRRFHDQRIDNNVVKGTGYDSVVITYSDTYRGDFQGTYNAPKKVEIYIPDGADQGLNSGDNFLHILNGFFGTSVGFTAISF